MLVMVHRDIITTVKKMQKVTAQVFIPTTPSNSRLATLLEKLLKCSTSERFDEIMKACQFVVQSFTFFISYIDKKTTKLRAQKWDKYFLVYSVFNKGVAAVVIDKTIYFIN
jgi:hypothetical protein